MKRRGFGKEVEEGGSDSVSWTQGGWTKYITTYYQRICIAS